MPPRYTIRQVVGTYRRKAFGTRNDNGSPRRPPYPPAAIAAFYGMLELAEEQPMRGHFESERLLRLLLEGPDGRGRLMAKQVPFLVQQGDLVRDDAGGVDVEGWPILQEGDVTVGERVARFRARKREEVHGAANAPANGRSNGRAVTGVTPGATADVTQDPRTGDARAPRRARNAGATDSATATGFGGGSGEAGESRARGSGLSRISVDDMPVGLADLDELPPAPTTTNAGTRR